MALSVGAHARSLVPFGEGEHALPPGSVFTIVEIAEPGAAGVETSAEPVVIVEHAYEAAVLRGGEWVTDTHTRRLGFPESRFTENFEPCEDTPS